MRRLADGGPTGEGEFARQPDKAEVPALRPPGGRPLPADRTRPALRRAAAAARSVAGAHGRRSRNERRSVRHRAAMEVFERLRTRDHSELVQARKALTEHVFGLVAAGETDELKP